MSKELREMGCTCAIDLLLLKAEADAVCDVINAIGRGELPYYDAVWDAQLARLRTILNAMKAEPVGTGVVN